MPSVCFYFQVHQPMRLRHYTVFDDDDRYFDEAKNAAICRKVANKCYLPTNRLLLKLIQKHKGRFKIAYSFFHLIRRVPDAGKREKCIEQLAYII